MITAHDPPFRMPSGYIIAESAINTLTVVNDGTLVCPATGKHFKKTDLRKIFFS